MLNCQQIDPLVTPYIDRQLPQGERRLVDDHLRVCPPCHSRVRAEEAVHALVTARRLELRNTCAPSALRAKCQSLCSETRSTLAPSTLAPGTPAPKHPAPEHPTPQHATARHATPEHPTPHHPTPNTRPWSSRLAPFAIAASLTVVVGGAFLFQATHMSSRVMAAELAADHVKCFAMNSALGTHEGAGAVESTMLASFDWRMHLPANADRAGLELVGARPCLYGEGKIAHIMYRHDGHPLSLFMLPNTARSKDLIEVLGHEAAVWCANNRTYVLVSREPRADVERLAAFVQASLRQEQ
jgi:anti-sigma factor RsiW